MKCRAEKCTKNKPGMIFVPTQQMGWKIGALFPSACSKIVHLSKVTKIFVGQEYCPNLNWEITDILNKYSQPCFPYFQKCTLSQILNLPTGNLRSR